MSGKGSKVRPYDGTKYREGFDRIFRKRRVLKVPRPETASDVVSLAFALEVDRKITGAKTRVKFVKQRTVKLEVAP